MKQITELTEKEILALTESELQTMVKLQMAEKGVKILSIPLEPKYEEVPKPTEELHTVSGFTYSFKDVADANKLSSAIRDVAQNCLNYDYNYKIGSDFKFIKSLENYSKDHLGSITPVKCYSKEVYNEVVEIGQRNQALKEEYSALLDEYNKAHSESQEIKDEIYGRYYDVQKKYYDMGIIKARYEEYLSLADGDVTMAMKFLKKAYSVDEETEAFITTNEIVEVDKPVKKVKK